MVLITFTTVRTLSWVSHTGDFLEVSTKEKDAIVRKLPAEIFPEYFLIRVNEFNKVAVTPLEEWIEDLTTGVIHP